MTKHKGNSELKKNSSSEENHSKQLKKSLIKTRNAIRKKYLDLHNEKLAISERVNKEYQPIIEPLKSLAAETKKKQQIDESKWKYDQLKNIKNEKLMGVPNLNNSLFETALPPHRRKLFSWETATSSKPNTAQHTLGEHDVSGISRLQLDNDESDNEDNADNEEWIQKKNAEDLLAGQDPTTVEKNIIKQIRTSHSRESVYGIRTSDGELRLGNDKVHVEGNNNDANYKYRIRSKKFTATPGLTSLLLEVKPKYYSQSDLKAYKDMLLFTNAHKKNFSAKGAVSRDPKSIKYNEIIAQMFPKKGGKQSSNSGAGLFLKKKTPQLDYKIAMKNTKIDYTYWDDPNELVDRLRLLLASMSAGHTGHNNEVISIIEELREAKFIN